MIIYWARFHVDTLAVQCGTTAQLEDWEHEYSWGQAHKEVLVQTDKLYEPYELYVDTAEGKNPVPKNYKKWVLRRFEDDEPIVEIEPLTIERRSATVLALAVQGYNERVIAAVQLIKAATTKSRVDEVLAAVGLFVTDDEVSIAAELIKRTAKNGRSVGPLQLTRLCWH